MSEKEKRLFVFDRKVPFESRFPECVCSIHIVSPAEATMMVEYFWEYGEILYRIENMPDGIDIEYALKDGKKVSIEDTQYRKGDTILVLSGSRNYTAFYIDKIYFDKI